MKRRQFLRNTVCLMGMTSIPLSSTCTKNRGSRKNPNVILILTDDQGWGDVHFNGNEKIDTPYMDKLAKEGVRFDRFFVEPVCAPTRAGLLTGRYYLRTGALWVTHGAETMDADETTIAEALKNAGYATGCFGKWHNGAHYPQDPNGQGFDEFYGFCGGNALNYQNTPLQRNQESAKSEGYISDVFTDAAIDFIEKNKDNPFFCYIPYNAPHTPFQVPDSYFNKYKDRGFSNENACIYGMVENIDDNIGRILDKLDNLNLTENTLVIFLTDNGANLDRYNGDMRGRKGSAHEGGVRVPCFFYWLGELPSGLEIKQIAAHIDLLPTILDICCVPRPNSKPIDGVSLVPLLRGETENWPERLIFTLHTGGDKLKPTNGSVRSQRHRLVVTAKGSELYDMQADPGEKNDISRKDPATAQKLYDFYMDWFEETTKGVNYKQPIPVGYAQAKRVDLHAHESFRKGGVRFSSSNPGWTFDWLTNWKSTRDEIWWEIDVVSSGEYNISVLYTCAEKAVGAKIDVQVAANSANAAIIKAYDPELVRPKEQVPAKYETGEKDWAELEIGTMKIEAGLHILKTKLLRNPNYSPIDLKAVRVYKLSG